MKYGKKQIAWFMSMLMVLMLISPMGTTVSFARKKNVKLKKIVLNHSTYKLQKGKSLKLKASLKPKKTTQKKVVWKSSKKKIAKVSKKGVVKGLKIGKATITAKVKGTKKKATCKIQVVNKVDKKNVTDTPSIHNDPVPQPPSDNPAVPQSTPQASFLPPGPPVSTPKYDRPDVPAPSVQFIDLTAEGAYQNESPSGASIVNNPDGSITVTFSQQYAALNFFLPDNAQNYYSNYKSVVVTYTSEGGDLGHALYDTQMAGPADSNAGKHPDWSSQIKESKEEHTLILKVSNECEGGCIRGFQIFNPNVMEEGKSITITIKSLIFSDKENPSAEDLKPIETPMPTEPGSTISPSASPSVPSSKPSVPPTKGPDSTTKPGTTPTKKPDSTTKPGGSSAAPSQKPNDPGATAAPVFNFELTKEGAIHNESKNGATIVNNPDGSVTVTFLNQYAALNFFLPDLTKGDYKSVVLTYTSEGGGLGHALYDTTVVGVTNTNAGKHPDWGKQVVESKTEKTLIFKVTKDCIGGFIRGFQIFNPDKLDAGKTIKITIKSLVFSDKEDPKPEDLNPTPTPTATPKPTPTQTPKPIVTREPGPLGITSPGAEGDDVVWDCITFGSYYQSLYEPKQPPQSPVDNTEYKDSDGTSMMYAGGKYYKKEPIKWRVLSVDGNDALIVADQNMDTQPFHNQNCSEISWEGSSIRQWLNNDFYSTAFIEEEQNAILSTTVSTEDNPQYGTANGGDTTDKLYLLSAEEVRNKNYGFAMYHEKDSQTRQVKNTAYADAKGAWADDAGNGWWWQRSLGSFPFNAVYTGSGGVVDCSGYIVVNEGGGVRPAMHLNLLSASWKQAGQVRITSAAELEPTPTPTESPVKKVSLSEVVIDSKCGSYDLDSDTVRVNDTQTDPKASTFMYFPIPVKVAPGQKLKVTVSGTSWGTSDFRIWTVPQGGETAGDFVQDNSIFLNPTVNADNSFTGTVELIAKGRECDRITLKPLHGVKIKNLVISEIKVELVPQETTAASP